MTFKVKITIPFLWVILLFVRPLAAQHYAFRTLGLEEGLPARKINDLCWGPRGYLWLATEGAGLVRYNGSDFQSLGNTRHPVITQLLSDAENQNLWYLSEQSLWRYDGRAARQFALPPGQRGAELVWNRGPLVRSRNGKLWRWREKGWQEPINLPPATRDIHFLGDSLFAATDSGVYRQQGERWERLVGGRYYKLFGADALTALGPAGFWPKRPDQAESALGPWQGGWQSGRLTLLWQEEELLWQKGSETMRVGRANGLPAGKWNRALGDSLGRVVLVGDRGIALWDGPRAATYPQKQQVFDLCPWQSQTVLATDQGLRFGVDSLAPLYGASGLVLSTAIFNEALYLGTERGLFRFSDGQLKPLPFLDQEFVFVLLPSDTGLWLGTGSGIGHWSPRGFRSITDEHSLPPATIFAAGQAPDGALWFASYTQGFFRLHEGQWKQITRLGGMALDSVRFGCFWPLSAQALCLGTSNDGLYVLDQNEREHYDFFDLNFAEVRAITAVAQEGAAKALWLGTNKGLLPLDELRRSDRSRAPRFLPYQGPGVSGQFFAYHAPFLWGASADGIFRWEIPQAGLAKHSAQAEIQDLNLLRQEETNLAQYAQDSLPFRPLLQGLELPYDVNYLTLVYHGKNLFQAEHLQFRYRLLGQSDNWTYAGNRREALFTDLSPGRYRFEVQGRLPGQEWHAVAEVYAFSIRPPFWSTWWFLSGLGLLLGGVAFFIGRDRFNRIREKLELEKALMETERKALRLQMNPHFIFNALDSISSFIFKQEPRQAVRYLNNFAKLMRLTLESSVEPLHPVESEVSALKNYLELEKLRFGDRFDYQIDVDEKIDYDMGIPPMLIQPHVENAILHGLKPRSAAGGKLWISFEREGDHALVVKVRDNGIGREKSRELNRNKRHRSMATQINRDRLALLGKAYRSKVELKISDLYDSNQRAIGTEVYLRLPAEPF